MTAIHYISGKSYLQHAHHLVQAERTEENIQKIKHFATSYFVEDPIKNSKYNEKKNKQERRSFTLAGISTSLALGSMISVAFYASSLGFLGALLGITGLWASCSFLDAKMEEDKEYALAMQARKLLQDSTTNHAQLNTNALPTVRDLQPHNLENFDADFADRQRIERERAANLEAYHAALDQEEERRREHDLLRQELHAAPLVGPPRRPRLAP